MNTSRKSWLAYQAQFNMAVIRIQEREQKKKDTERLIKTLESIGFKED